MTNLIEILKRCESILATARAPQNDIQILKSLIDSIANSDSMSIEQFFADIAKNRGIEKRQIKEKRTKLKLTRTLTDIEKLADIYRKINDKKTLNDSEGEIIREFEGKYPNIRSFVLGDLSNLYDRISEIDEKTWSMEELRLLLCFHFHIKPSQGINKTKLLTQLKKNIYNLNYMDSMKKQYERKT